MADTEQDPSPAARLAYELALGIGIYLAAVGVIMLVIAKRDALTRTWQAATRRRVPAEEAAIATALAEVRREISRLEHGYHPAPAPQPPGLYEWPW